MRRGPRAIPDGIEQNGAEMNPREEIETLQGESRTGVRPPTEAERQELLARARVGRRQAWWGRLGCWLSPLFFLGIIVALSLVPKESGFMIVLVMATGFTGLAWMLLSSRDARQRAALSQRDATAQAVESYKIDGKEVEALDTTGRVIRIDDERPEATYATRRVVGLPHALVQDDRSLGPRRLSDAESDEIDRLIAQARIRVDFVEAAMIVIAFLMVAGTALIARDRGWSPSMLVMPALFLFAVVSKGLARLSLFRLRQALRFGKREGRVIGVLDGGLHIEILAGKVVWTVDGQPSDLRTRWAP